MSKLTDTVNNVKTVVVDAVHKPNLDIETVLRQAIKVPGVKINRADFLRKELIIFYPNKVIDIAIAKNPAYAGIPKAKIDEISDKVISYETNKVSAISFIAGVPGGYAMVATVSADIVQYFAFILRVMQKLAYLYGFEEFDLREDSINDGTMNEILMFLGAMFGVQEANIGIKLLAETVSAKIAKSLANKALTKGTVYPIVKNVAKHIGVRMTKQVFANGVSKAVPIIGGCVSGGLTYASFKPCAKRLKKSFGSLDLCSPEKVMNTVENQ